MRGTRATGNTPGAGRRATGRAGTKRDGGATPPHGHDGDGRRRREMFCPRCMGVTERCTHAIGELSAARPGFPLGADPARGVEHP